MQFRASLNYHRRRLLLLSGRKPSLKLAANRLIIYESLSAVIDTVNANTYDIGNGSLTSSLPQDRVDKASSGSVQE